MSPQKPPGGSSWPATVDLAKDTWVFEAQWGARPDDLANCTERLLACLNGVASFDRSLEQWFYNADPVPLTTDSLRHQLDQGWDREDPSGEIGSTVALWNGAQDDLVATITVSCGSTASYLKNDVEFVPPRPAAMPGLYQVETMLTLFETMISAWQPQWCRVRPRSLREATGREFVDVIASWIIYLDRGVYQRRGALPNEVRVIERPGGGELFVLASTPEELRLDTIDQLRERVAFPDEWRLLR